MAEFVINSFFTNAGIPATGLTPTVRIWEVDGSTYDLVVGAPIGSGQPTDGVMSPVIDTGEDDGFYSFIFTDLIGYNPEKTYLVRADGGVALNQTDRLQSASLTPMDNVMQVVDEIWEAPSTDYPYNPGTPTMGGKINATHSNVEQLLLDMVDVQLLLDCIAKYDTNRTKIDPVAKTLTVYDDDCTTPLRIFNLYDSNGNPSVEQVCERKPVASTDGKPVCP